MKRRLKLTAAMAATLAGAPACTTQDDWGDDTMAEYDTAFCTDSQGYRVDDDLCDDSQYGGGYYGYNRYYLRKGNPIPYYGDSVNDPRFRNTVSRNPAFGVNYGRAPVATSMTRSQAISRGGLGSRGSSFGGGRS